MNQPGTVASMYSSTQFRNNYTCGRVGGTAYASGAPPIIEYVCQSFNLKKEIYC